MSESNLEPIERLVKALRRLPGVGEKTATRLAYFMLSAPETRRLLATAGFEIVRTDFVFFFPGCLRSLRALEPHLCGVPFGAQYLVLARRPA